MARSEHANVDLLRQRQRVATASEDQVSVERPSDLTAVLHDEFLLYAVTCRHLDRVWDFESDDLHGESLLHLAERQARRHDLVEWSHCNTALRTLCHGEDLGVFDQSAQLADCHADELWFKLL